MRKPKRGRFGFAIVGLVTMLLLSMLSLPPATAQTVPPQCADGYALWADGTGDDETLTISGSDNSITGRARSNADFRISGSNNSISERVQYVTVFEDDGDSNSYPTPGQVSPADAPVSYSIADYRPGGRAAVAAAAAGRYTQISGDFDVSDPVTLDGLYYVSGEVDLSAGNIQGTFTIVAEDDIDVSGSDIRAEAYVDGLLFFSNERDSDSEVIELAGSNSNFQGVIYAPGGTLEFSGSDNRFAGIIVGDELELSGSSLRIRFDNRFCSGGGTTPTPTPPDEDEDDPKEPDPPAIVIINDDSVSHTVEIINNIVFVNIQVTIINTGGKTKDTFLIINLPGRGDDDDDDDDDDDRFEMVDVRFLEGIGYVREYSEQRIVIGMGRYNVLRGNSPVTVDVQFRMRDDDDDDDDDDDGREIRFAPVGELFFNDSTGDQTLLLPMPVVVIPAAEQPQSQPDDPQTDDDLPRLSLERIDLRFEQTWQSQGGIAIFGLPLSEARTDDDGTLYQVFERARLEYRAEIDIVQYGRLAAELGYARAPDRSFDELDDDDREWFFIQTGQVIAEPFRGFWSNRGGLLLFGLPISPIYDDDDGRPIQCFERVCMHYFPEFSDTPSVVQLRLLGVEWLRAQDDD